MPKQMCYSCEHRQHVAPEIWASRHCPCTASVNKQDCTAWNQPSPIPAPQCLHIEQEGSNSTSQQPCVEERLVILGVDA